MSAFGRHTREAQPKLNEHAGAPPDSADYRFAASMLIDARRTFLSFQKFCASSGLPDPDKWENIETIFSVAEALSHAGVKHVNLDGVEYSIKTVLRDLQTWIWKTYQQLPSPSLRRPDQAAIDTSPYEMLAQRIVELRAAHNIDVITTNYDAVFEYFAFKFHLPTHYPFSWKDGFGAGRGRNEWVLSPDKPGLGSCVCKLHGSVNYFENLDSPRDGIAVAADCGGDQKIGNSNIAGTFRDEPAILAMDAIWTIRKRFGEGFTPVIVPPTYAKLRRRKWLATTWNRALESLVQARCIIFVGYSMPRTDGFLRALITGAMAKRPSGSPPEVYVVDPCPDTHTRFREVFGPVIRGWFPRRFDSGSCQAILDVIHRHVKDGKLSLDIAKV
jgi:hypothetical protein